MAEVRYKNIAIISDQTDSAEQCKSSILEKYDFLDITKDSAFSDDIDAIIAVGGDGYMLQCLHEFMKYEKPIYGINKGTIGFLLNEYSEKNLVEKINNAVDAQVHPLKMTCKTKSGEVVEALAVNEVSLIRTSGQAAKIKIEVDGVTHIDEMISDGVLVATPAGSSAYNYSNGGMILPIKSNLISLTPICPFRPRRWRGALLPNHIKVNFEVLKHWKRPVKAVADNYEVMDVVEVDVALDESKKIHVLFDRGHSLEERILREQFAVC